MEVSIKRASPSKTGFSDAIMGKPCISPWKDFARQQAYTQAYMRGQKDNAKNRKAFPQSAPKG